MNKKGRAQGAPILGGHIARFCCRAFGIAQMDTPHRIKVRLALLPHHPYSRKSHMPQNTKDSKGGKTKPVKDTGDNGGKRTDKGSADNKAGSPTGSHNKGERKTTP